MMFTRLIAVFSPLFLLSFQVLAQGASVFVDIGPCMAMSSDLQRYTCYDQLEAQIRAAQVRDTPASPQPRATGSIQTRQTDLPVVSIPRNTRQTQQQDEPLETEQPTSQQAGVQPASVSDFGLEGPSQTRNREENARVFENEDGSQELVDTIAGLEERVPGQWEITLASGQVWRQMNSKRFRLREGMEVRIYPSPFGGSFRLSASNLNGFIQVQRTK